METAVAPQRPIATVHFMKRDHNAPTTPRRERRSKPRPLVVDTDGKLQVFEFCHSCCTSVPAEKMSAQCVLCQEFTCGLESNNCDGRCLCSRNSAASGEVEVAS